MDVFSNIMLGLGVASSLQNLMYCMIGALLGTMVGVLPGIGPVTTLALLLPISFTLDPISALIMMAGIYYGAQYGGSTTAILINIPGEASSVVTSLDGHQMARQGRAGPALGIAALGSFFAGCVAALVIAFGAPPLAKVALQFGPAEYFSLMVCGLIAAVVLAHGSIVKAIGMVLLGLSVRPRGFRHQFGRAPLHLRHLGPCRRRRVRRAVHGDLRACRSRDQPGEGRAEKRHRQQRRTRAAELGGHSPVHTVRAARHRARLASWRASRRRRASGLVRRLHAGEESRQPPAHVRARRHQGRRRAGIGQQRRRTDVHDSRCSPWASPPIRRWR